MEKQRQSATDRHAQLVALVKGRGYCSVAEMSQILNVSPMTIRRDLSILQEKHIVEVMYGGARFIASGRTEPDFATRSLEHLAAKQAIGKQAIELIEEGDVIGIDSGSTIVEVARNLPNVPLTVVTQSLPAANIVVQNKLHRLIVLGGVLQPGSDYFYGPRLSQPCILYISISSFLQQVGCYSLTVSPRITCPMPKLNRLSSMLHIKLSYVWIVVRLTVFFWLALLHSAT